MTKLILLASPLLAMTMTVAYANPLLEKFDLPESLRNAAIQCERPPADHSSHYWKDKLEEQTKAPAPSLSNLFFEYVDSRDVRDGCDKVKVLYVAAIIALYWPGSVAAEENPLYGNIVERFLTRALDPNFSKNALLRNAVIEARKLIAAK